MPTVVTPSVCLSVRKHATGHTFMHRNLILGLNDTWDMRKKHFFRFRNCHFYAFYLDFSLFPYITLIFNFSSRDVIFELIGPFTMSK